MAKRSYKKIGTIGMIVMAVVSFSLFVEGASQSPSGLMTDLLERTEQVWQDGFPTTLSLSELPTAIERTQYAAIENRCPSFSWIVNDTNREITQKAYEIEVATSPDHLTGDEQKKPDLWSSGRTESTVSSGIRYAGRPLAENQVVWWRVRTWNNRGEKSPWSECRSFKTADKLTDFAVSRYPVVKTENVPVTSKKINERLTFYDFGTDAFAQCLVRATSKKGGQMVTVRLGERIRDGRVDTKPAGSTRFAEYHFRLLPGRQTWFVKTRVDRRNTTGAAVLMPGYIGEVMPFRYAEIELDQSDDVTIEEIRRYEASYPFDETASFFACNDDSLNRIWEFCRRSIKATSFLGIYIDGDRERIPYEGDALLNQLSHYAVDREYSLARYSQEYMIFHPTWPTEWILQSVQMAWYDYLYTGDSRYIEKYYDELKAKSLIALAEENGLISTRKGKLDRNVLKSIHFSNGKIKDIVDWPHKGLAGNENTSSGETDGFVFCDFNAVVNAYHYFALRSMARFATILKRTDDVTYFKEQAEKVHASYQKVFFDTKQNIYRDGDTTNHASLHGNMFPLAFGLVPDEHVKSVVDFIRSRGMKCSVYGAQFFLDAVYEGGEGSYGFERMTTTDIRGWLNMLKIGSTLSLEAWDDRYKPNQDWNHAWGAAPANIIPRKLVGVEPLEPAFAKMRIRPQIDKLTEVNATVPTVRGPVLLAIRQKAGQRYELRLTIPANTKADVILPRFDQNDIVQVDGGPKPVADRFGWILPDVGSGTWTFIVEKKQGNK